MLGKVMHVLGVVGACALTIPIARTSSCISPPEMTRLSGPVIACVGPSADAGGKAEALDPRDALKELGSLLEQVKLVWTEGGGWSPEERAERRRELVTTYVRVFAPAVAFSGVQLGVSLGTFGTVLVLLQSSGRGYPDLLNLSQGVPLLDSALGKIDPSLGNGAIALLVVEVLAPLLIGISLAAAPSATQSLQQWLEARDLDADGINARIEKVLDDTQ